MDAKRFELRSKGEEKSKAVPIDPYVLINWLLRWLLELALKSLLKKVMIYVFDSVRRLASSMMIRFQNRKFEERDCGFDWPIVFSAVDDVVVLTDPFDLLPRLQTLYSVARDLHICVSRMSATASTMLTTIHSLPLMRTLY